MNIVSEFILQRAQIKRIIIGRYGGSYIVEAGSSGGDNSSDSSYSTTLREWLINVRGSALAPNFLSSLSTSRWLFDNFYYSEHYFAIYAMSISRPELRKYGEKVINRFWNLHAMAEKSFSKDCTKVNQKLIKN